MNILRLTVLSLIYNSRLLSPPRTGGGGGGVGLSMLKMGGCGGMANRGEKEKKESRCLFSRTYFPLSEKCNNRKKDVCGSIGSIHLR